MADHPLLADIDAFIAKHKMAESTFGREALGDWRFIAELRNGRRVWPETEGKVRRFMVTYVPAKAAA